MIGDSPGLTKASNVFPYHDVIISRTGSLRQLFRLATLWYLSIDQPHKSHDAPVPYPTMHHSEQKCANFYWCRIWNRCITGFVRLVFKSIFWSKMGTQTSVDQRQSRRSLCRVAAETCCSDISEILLDIFQDASQWSWSYLTHNLIDIKVWMSNWNSFLWYVAISVAKRPLKIHMDGQSHVTWSLTNALTLHWRHNERNGVSNYQHRDCLLNRLFRFRSKKTSKLRVTGLCEGNSPGTGEFPAQRASNAENASIWWRHHKLTGFWYGDKCWHPSF